MTRQVIVARMRDLLGTEDFTLEHHVDSESESLVLTHVEEGWTLEAKEWKSDPVKGDPSLSIYEQLLNLYTRKQLERVKRVLDNKE